MAGATAGYTWWAFGGTLFATFIGATLAFGFSFFTQHLQRRRDEYAAAAAAMEVLRTQVDDFKNFASGFQKEQAAARTAAGGDHVPKWAVARPMTFYFFDSAKFDYGRLGHLVERGTGGIVTRLRYADRRYQELRLLLDQYNEVAKEKHERMAKAGFEPDATPTIPAVAAALGADVVGALMTLISAIEYHCQVDLADYEKAESALREATSKRFPKRPKLGIELGSRETPPRSEVVSTRLYDLSEIVATEVSRREADFASRLAHVDRQIIAESEQVGLTDRERGERSLAALKAQVDALEGQLSTSSPNDRSTIAMALRELYSRYLAQGRHHFASSSPYQSIRDRVLIGLQRIVMTPEKYEAIKTALSVDRKYATVESPDGSLWQFQLIPKEGGPSAMVVVEEDFVANNDPAEISAKLSEWNVVSRAVAIADKGFVVVTEDGPREMPRTVS